MPRKNNQALAVSKSSSKRPSKRKQQDPPPKTISISKLRKKIKSILRKKPVIRANQDPTKCLDGSKVFKEVNNLVCLMKKDQLQCSICLEYCVYPILTQCGHFFCLTCFQSISKQSEQCSLCRQLINVTEYQPSAYLQNLFQMFIQKTLDVSQSAQYKKRVEEITSSQIKRKISELLRVGSKVDYHHKDSWVEAQIISIQNQTLTIKFTNSLFQQPTKVQISKKSRLIAPHNLFTNPPETRISSRAQKSAFRSISQPVQENNSWQNLIDLGGGRGDRWFPEEINEQQRRDWALRIFNY